jgi:hypothetical protein
MLSLDNIALKVSWIPTKMNYYSSHNYKQHGPSSNSCRSNITNYLILLPPKNLLLEIFNPKHRAKMKLKLTQK